MNQLLNAPIRYKWIVLALVVLLSAFFAYQLRFLEVDSNIINALPEDDPVVREFKEVGDRFGSNQIGLIVVQDANIFDAGTLDHVRQITDSLSAMEGILSVRSITNTMTFRSEGDAFEIDDLISPSERPETAADAERLKDEVTSNDIVRGTLVDASGTSTIVLFHFRSDADIEVVASAVVEKINGMGFPEEIYFAGSTFLQSYVAQIISKDMLRLIPVAFVLIALVLFLSFRSWRGVILPLLSAGLAILWAMGTFTLLGFKLSMVSNNVPIIVLAVGSAYAIHVFNRIHQSPPAHKVRAIRRAMQLVALPVVLSGLTTMVGFVSFIFGAYLHMIRDFGILAALGTLYATLLALYFVPALLAALPASRKTAEERGPNGRVTLMQKFFLNPILVVNVHHPKRSILVWLVLVTIGAAGMFMVERSVSVSDYFKNKHPASQADDVMEAKYGGSRPVYAVFKGDIQEPEVLRGMAAFSEYLQQSPYVTSTQSIVDVVVRLNNALSDEKGIPDEKAKVQQLWFFLGRQDLSQLITEDLDEAVIMAKFNNEGQANIDEFAAYVDAYLRDLDTDAYSIHVSGMPYVNARMDRSLVRSQITSLLLAVLLVFLLVSLIFRSFLEGAYASAPIIATIIVLYGVMGLTGIPLNVATVLVASVAMGIGIDYSIHYISSFNLALKRHKDIDKAAEDAIMISGKAIFVNFVSVSAGFLVLIFSDLMPMVYFGILIALSMLGSAMGALTLLPAIIILSKRRASLLHVVGE